MAHWFDRLIVRFEGNRNTLIRERVEYVLKMLTDFLEQRDGEHAFFVSGSGAQREIIRLRTQAAQLRGASTEQQLDGLIELIEHSLNADWLHYFPEQMNDLRDIQSTLQHIRQNYYDH